MIRGANFGVVTIVFKNTTNKILCICPRKLNINVIFSDVLQTKILNTFL